MTVVLSTRAAKLMTLCEAEGFETLGELLEACGTDSVVPGICLTEGCDYTCQTEPDQDQGYCEACQGQSIHSVLILAGLI